MIAHGLPIYVALEPVDMRLGYERLGGLVREKMAAELAALVSALQVELVGLKSRVTEREAQIDSLRETILNLSHENELLKRRIYGNKTERTHTSELQLALGNLLDDEKRLQKQLDEAVDAARKAAAERQELFLSKAVRQAAVAGKDDAEQRAGIEFLAGQEPELVEDGDEHLLRLVDDTRTTAVSEPHQKTRLPAHQTTRPRSSRQRVAETCPRARCPA